MRNSIAYACLLVCLVFSSSCATMSDVLKEKSKGTSRVYDVNKDQAWKIAMTVFRWEGADSIEEHKEEGYMVTSSGMNMVSAGTLMAAWAEPDGDKTRVTIVTKRRIATNIATTLTEGTFHRRFEQAKAILKSGKSLPIEAPLLESEKKAD